MRAILTSCPLIQKIFLTSFAHPILFKISPAISINQQRSSCNALVRRAFNPPREHERKIYSDYP